MSFKDNLQYTIETKFLSKQETYVYSRENYRFKYRICFEYMLQTNLDTQKQRTVYRRPLLVTKDDVAKWQL